MRLFKILFDSIDLQPSPFLLVLVFPLGEPHSEIKSDKGSVRHLVFSVTSHCETGVASLIHGASYGPEQLGTHPGAFDCRGDEPKDRRILWK